jgi:hypothetical protein
MVDDCCKWVCSAVAIGGVTSLHNVNGYVLQLTLVL